MTVQDIFLGESWWFSHGEKVNSRPDCRSAGWQGAGSGWLEKMIR